MVYQVSDRLSFQKFAGGPVADKVPDANTLWDFRAARPRAGGFEKLFEQFAQQLQAQGLPAPEGQLVDASFVDGPRQRNARAENAPIPAGGGPAAWAAEPAKPPQKDGTARWTQKNAEGHYGSQNPVKADAKSKLIKREAGTAASVPAAQKLAALVAPVDGPVSAASAYRGGPELSNKKAGPKPVRLPKGLVVGLQSRAEVDISLSRVWAWRDMAVKIIETW